MMRLFIVSCAIFLSACSSSPKDNIVNNAGNRGSIEQNSSENLSMDEDALLFYLLRREFSHWQGTPYRLGGNSKRGIDCSALIQNIYRDSFNIKLPRTTETQVKQGDLVYRNQLKIGDLVFFKTGWNVRHVGIYIGNDEFIHASTSRGVITSSLNNVYWKSKYWQARRILD